MNRIEYTCAALHYLFNGLEKHVFPFDGGKIPSDGIYILFERGEVAHRTNRIVRVGTHTGVGQLRSRLNQHFSNENKDRSIFRKNVGRAILNRDNDPFLAFWGLDLTSSEMKKRYLNQIDLRKQTEIERRVTDYIQSSLSFVVFGWADKLTRLLTESRIISTVSLCNECRPSKNWLGLHSPKSKIRESGLWLVNELYKEPLTESDFDTLRRIGR